MKLIAAVMLSLVMFGCHKGAASSLYSIDEASAAGATTVVKIGSGSDALMVDAAQTSKNPLQQLDSGFNYARGDLSISGDLASVVKDRSAKACYVGVASQACEILKGMDRAGEAYYSAGNHDLTRLLSCDVVGNEVLVGYSMITDYDDYEINAEKVILPCQ